MPTSSEPLRAIAIRDLSKRYVIGERERGQETFREMLLGSAGAAWRRLTGRGSAPDATTLWALRDINLDITPGEVVVHTQWGEGTVQRIEGEVVVVRFDAVGYRSMHTPTVMERGLLRSA